MEQYSKYKQKYPDWTDDQIWTAISLDMQTDKIVDGYGEDIDPNDPDIVEEIIRGSMEWLNEALPNIFKKVEQFFSYILSNRGEWLMKGISQVIKLIGKYFTYFA